jgi:hypothetical protein
VSRCRLSAEAVLLAAVILAGAFGAGIYIGSLL